MRRQAFDSGLAPYNLHGWKQWQVHHHHQHALVAIECAIPSNHHVASLQGLTSFIDSIVLRRLAPLNGAAMSVLAEEGPAGPATPAELRLAEQLQCTVWSLFLCRLLRSVGYDMV